MCCRGLLVCVCSSCALDGEKPCADTMSDVHDVPACVPWSWGGMTRRPTTLLWDSVYLVSCPLTKPMHAWLHLCSDRVRSEAEAKKKLKRRTRRKREKTQKKAANVSGQVLQTAWCDGHVTSRQASISATCRCQMMYPGG